MLVECKLKRQGGTHVDLQGVAYHFKDDGTGRHVAMVTNEDHLGRFLSVSEAYRLAPGATLQPVAVVEPLSAVPAPPVAAPVQPVAVVAQPEPPSPEPEQAASVGGRPEVSEDMDIDTIRAIYEAEIGRKPSPNWKAVSMIAGINAARKATT